MNEWMNEWMQYQTLCSCKLQWSKILLRICFGFLKTEELWIILIENEKKFSYQFMLIFRFEERIIVSQPIEFVSISIHLLLQSFNFLNDQISSIKQLNRQLLGLVIKRRVGLLYHIILTLQPSYWQSSNQTKSITMEEKRRKSILRENIRKYIVLMI